jgi:hypothetical protein
MPPHYTECGRPVAEPYSKNFAANSEFLIMLNQASTEGYELAKLLNISTFSFRIHEVDAGHGLFKVGSSLVPFANKFPKNTKLYKLMTTKRRGCITLALFCK